MKHKPAVNSTPALKPEPAVDLTPPPRLQVRQGPTPDRQALHTLDAVAAGTVIAPFTAQATHPQPARHTLQVDARRHIELAPDCLRFVNHACEPNATFDVDRLEFRALLVIEAGEELTCFYPSTEWHLDEAFACACGSPRCIGLVQGAAFLAAEVLGRHDLSAFVRAQVHARRRVA